jgi:hypothetical protein
VTHTLDSLHTGAAPAAKSRPRADIFKGWWLQSFGLALAALYLLYFLSLYRGGNWIIGRTGLPIYTDFGFFWVAGIEALNGNVPALYDPTELTRLQAAFFQPSDFIYLNWAYPPTFLLMLAPLALLPYRWAFIIWDVLTLAGCVAAVYLIVRRSPAVALALAAPFTAWNFLAAQNGFLTASLMGASLYFLECRPIVAGIFIGLLSYKPQFGILFPVALLACRQWRAIAGAAATIAVLAATSIALFGTESWVAFPRELFTQAGLDRVVAPDSNWSFLLRMGGFFHSLRGFGTFVYLVQGATAIGLAIIIWRVWRSPARYALKAAALSAAALLVSPHVFTYDLAAIMIPAAFLAADQLKYGLLRGDKAIWIVLFGVPLAVLVTLGDNAHGPTFSSTPVGVLTTIGILAVIIRRIYSSHLRYSQPVPEPITRLAETR